MAEETDEEADEQAGEAEADPDPEYPDPPERETAPQSDYTMRDVGVGAVITVVGVLLTFVVPFLL